MHRYLRIQESPVTDNITDDGHVGAQMPWPVLAGPDGIVVVPSSYLMRRVIGFQSDLAVQQIDLYWADAHTDPAQAVGMYLVAEYKDGQYASSLSAVDTAAIIETDEPIPVER